ncbi:TonB-dependent receptor plug domain-containing protein [Pseudodesulfovibrio cashew]|uniref:TonB-dependent receptor plug domain-containing protein n=1 Tax=Pseudodesulfovibrio cashew TaxID=2678688 RepID=A0A6I6JP30_9BACT|nr:TonB-dependent receptor plug domain-containing protein [Pseudodesulfovibrio cashew]QGY41992.1 TonB-dependent receptor plug domain-containing protein [Pseudodesulfovibrio cashew]
MRSGGAALALWLCYALLFGLYPVAALGDDSGELASLDLEELMEVEVVTATRRAEPLSQVAGAIVVLDEEDIFRSGATSLAEVLKLVPGVHVAQMDLDRWAVGIRGFNGLLSNKHLVLLDGRPITSPTTAGVDWGDIVPLSMVKRIEVVKGTWTHLWGADSFTGVINVITKTAAETQGGQSVTLAGTSGVSETLRYGGALGDNGNYRAYTELGYQSGNWIAEKQDARSSSDWKKKRFGFRTDWENAFTDALSLQGDLSVSSIEDGASANMHVYDSHTRDRVNGYAQFVWNRALGLDSGINFRTSFTRNETSVDDLTGGTNTLDAEVQYAAEQMGAHRFTWGMGSRYYWDNIESGDHTSIGQDNRYTFTANGFAMDRITLSEDSLYLTLGTKFDYFGQTPIEIQPTARLLHTRGDKEFWLAVSRAVRADTRWQRSGSYVIDDHGVAYTVNPPDSLTTEKLLSYEAGYRQRIAPDLRWDLSLYVNDYDELAMLVFNHATHTATLGNVLKGTAYGVEAQLEWKAADWLTLRPSASTIYQNIYGMDEPPGGESMPEEGLGYELKLQTMTTPMKDVGFDFLVGYMDGPTDRNLPGYFSLEAHTSWRASETLMLELIGRNLGEATEQYSSLQVGPSVDLRITWDF